MRNRVRESWREFIVVPLLVLSCALIFGVLVWQMIYNLGYTDYDAHILFTTKMLQDHVLPQAHVLFQICLVGLTTILPISMEWAAVVTAVAFYVLAALILYRLARESLRGKGWLSTIFSAVMALALLLVAPINQVIAPDQHLYFGYISINALHNPTIVLLRPLALLLFAFAVGILNHRFRFGFRTLVTGVLLVALCLQAKPNYMLVLLPVLPLVVVARLVLRDRAGLITLIVALILPMILLLVLEYQIQYQLVNNDGTSIIFAPLATLAEYVPIDTALISKFVLSLLFPLAVYLLYWRQAARRLELNLAWLSFVAGAGQMYLFAESGICLKDANFWWSAQIALFILFVVSALYWLRRFRDRPDWRGVICLVIFALHLVCGVQFYNLQFHAQFMWDWW